MALPHRPFQTLPATCLLLRVTSATRDSKWIPNRLITTFAKKKKAQVALCIVRIVLEPNLKLGGKEVTESGKFTPGRFTASTLVCGLAPWAYSPHHETNVFGNPLSFRRGVSRYRSKASLGCWPLPSRVRSSQMNLEPGGVDQ